MGNSSGMLALTKLLVLLSLHCVNLFTFAVGLSKNSDFGSRINLTHAGFAWVTAMVGDDVYHEGNLETDSYSGKVGDKVEHEVEIEAPITSIDSMLQWAIGHSDAEKLKGAAQEVQRMTPQELKKRRNVIKELMEKLRMPFDSELMKIAIADLQNGLLSVEDHIRALEELLILVEPVDNANGMAELNKLGGLVAIIDELDRGEIELRVAAAAVLGKATQNNPVVQSQVLRLGVLPKLIRMARSVNPEEAVNAFYALSSIIQNYPKGQQMFYRSGGMLLITDLMTDVKLDSRLRKMALFLVADLAEKRIQAKDQLELFMLDERLLEAVVVHTESADLDTIHKALDAVKNLYSVDASIRESLRKTCEVESVLERLRLHFEKLMSDTEVERIESVRELEELRREVVELFSLAQTE